MGTMRRMKRPMIEVLPEASKSLRSRILDRAMAFLDEASSSESSEDASSTFSVGIQPSFCQNAPVTMLFTNCIPCPFAILLSITEYLPGLSRTRWINSSFRASALGLASGERRGECLPCSDSGYREYTGGTFK